MVAFVAFLSDVLGWTSTVAWSISFYPQALLNYRRQSVEGLSFEFVYLNVEGFLAYSVYNICLFASPSVRREYRHRNAGNDPSVRGNDVAFAVHAFLISVFTLSQTYIYRKSTSQHLAALAKLFILITSVGVIAGTIAAISGYIAWLDLLYYVSYVKLVISFTKLVPQAWMNYRRKSTVGWSIENILLDFTGGFCSLCQLLLDAHIHSDWRSLAGNPAKLVLGLGAMAFDILFLVQHYILYRNRDPHTAEGGSPGDIDREESSRSMPDERTRLL